MKVKLCNLPIRQNRKNPRNPKGRDSCKICSPRCHRPTPSRLRSERTVTTRCRTRATRSPRRTRAGCSPSARCSACGRPRPASAACSNSAAPPAATSSRWPSICRTASSSASTCPPGRSPTGRSASSKLGLKNVDAASTPASWTSTTSWGTFDYVICHGVFSWVPTDVQEKILDICSQADCRPNGIAYVSYNTYPGWHMRGMIRDMMRYHSVRFNTAAAPHPAGPGPARLPRPVGAAGRRPYSRAAEAGTGNAPPPGRPLPVPRAPRRGNDPLYFHQFVERAEGTRGCSTSARPASARW